MGPHAAAEKRMLVTIKGLRAVLQTNATPSDYVQFLCFLRSVSICFFFFVSCSLVFRLLAFWPSAPPPVFVQS